MLQDKRPLVFTIKTKKKQKLDFWNQNASGNFSHVGNLRFFSRNAMTGFVSMAASKKKKPARKKIKSNQNLALRVKLEASRHPVLQSCVYARAYAGEREKERN